MGKKVAGHVRLHSLLAASAAFASVSYAVRGSTGSCRPGAVIAALN